MSYYVKRVEKIVAYPFNGDWQSFVEEVRPPKFQVEKLDPQGNLTVRDNPRYEHVETRVRLWLHGAPEALTIGNHETLVRKAGEWSVVPSREFNEEWEPAS